jgi:hypothetical protein
MEERSKTNPAKLGDPTYFACSCQEEGKKECEQLLIDVKQLLSADDSNLLTKIVFSLNFDYGARITEIACDMWCEIWSKTYHSNEEGEPLFLTQIESDEVEVGIAATWFAYYKKFGNKKSPTSEQ